MLLILYAKQWKKIGNRLILVKRHLNHLLGTQYDIKKDFILNQINLFHKKYDTYDTLNQLKQELLPRLQANNDRVLYWVNEEKKLVDKALLNVA